MTRGMAVVDDSGKDTSKDDPRRKGGPYEDSQGDAKGVWCLLEVKPRPYQGGVSQV